jgi:hypothetical protein
VAAKNHELETAYDAERSAQRSQRHDAARELRERVAEGFLADKAQRAVAHPPPSPKRCYVVTDTGRVLFDVSIDVGLAKDVPPEAHRRFRTEVRAKEERTRQDRVAQLALHEEKKRFIAEWVDKNGTDEQKVRHASGMLPMDEAIQGITDHVFSVNSRWPTYARDGAERLQEFIRARTGGVDAVVSPSDLSVRSSHAVKATAAQWATVQDIQACVPDATVVLRQHLLSSNRHPGIPALAVFGVLVTYKYGPLTLRREYEVAGCPSGPEQRPIERVV